MGEVVPEKSNRVWTQLEQSLVKYNDTLEERSNLINEVSSLHTQNEELKELLNQYLGAKVNDMLHIPPTQVIRVDAGKK